jgi:hypothetical protein
LLETATVVVGDGPDDEVPHIYERLQRIGTTFAGDGTTLPGVAGRSRVPETSTTWAEYARVTAREPARPCGV